jgi:hypothetical protein
MRNQARSELGAEPWAAGTRRPCTAAVGRGVGDGFQPAGAAVVNALPRKWLGSTAM